jgi:predicted dehydrogenase
LSGQAGGGALNSFASHTFYYLEWLQGKIISVDARLHATAGSDARVECWLTFAGGATAAISISTDTVGLREHRLQIFGTDGMLDLRNSTHDYVNGFELSESSRDKSPVLVLAEPKTFEDGRAAAATSLIGRFARSVDGGDQMTPGVDEALRVQRIMHAARQSSKQSGTVVLDS